MAQLNIVEVITKKTAELLNISESIVEKVVSHKHRSVHEAQRLHTSVEDSGLGTFKIRPKVAIRRIRKIESFIKKIQGGKDLTQKDQERVERMTNRLLEEKAYLESKI